MNFVLWPLGGRYTVILGILILFAVILLSLNYKSVTKAVISGVLALVSIALVIGIMVNNVLPLIIAFIIVVITGFAISFAEW